MASLLVTHLQYAGSVATLPGKNDMYHFIINMGSVRVAKGCEFDGIQPASTSNVPLASYCVEKECKL